ncbi:hypothetical protein A0H81_02602 [Grifola frondosa]|uniref:Carbohydrate-binding module family 19 domain-containing protein n=1 Tax=Grifola frondosa TaxID=5627 RepID=A0A1C7MLK5_GRIFR|nr:hypothetical protein A0H81_02602 [Grifola frondosa]
MMYALATTMIALFASAYVSAMPVASLNSSTFLQNGQDAQKLNAEFASLNASDPSGDLACIGRSIARCVNSTWETKQCPSSQQCFALPSVREQGITLSCTSEATALSIMNATGATGGLASNTSTNHTVAFPTEHKCHNSTSHSSFLPSTSATATTASSSAPSTSSNSTDGVVVTVTVTFAPTSTLPTETFTVSPAEASSIIASITANGSFSDATTILPSSSTASTNKNATHSASVTDQGVVDGAAARSTTSSVAAPATITLTGRPASSPTAANIGGQY